MPDTNQPFPTADDEDPEVVAHADDDEELPCNIFICQTLKPE